MNTTYPLQGMNAFMRGFDWRQGEHILLAAPTNAGKSTLMEILLSKRIERGGYVVVFVSKPYDDLFDKTGFKGWTRIDRWGKQKPGQRKILLWPKPAKNLRDTATLHAEIFGEALNKIGQSKNWCVVIDELHWVAQECRLEKEVAILHHQGRSSGISMMCLTQRPAWVPVIIYSSVTYSFIARTRDNSDLKRLADLGGDDPKEVAHNVRNLPTRYDYVALHSQGDTAPAIINSRRR